MAKQIIWIVVIAIGVFMGVFAYEKFTEYRVQRVLQIEQERQQALIEQKRTKSAKDQRRNREAELYQNTACAINEDMGSCGCINEKTGVKISLPLNECVKRAREITW